MMELWIFWARASRSAVSYFIEKESAAKTETAANKRKNVDFISKKN